ncbi:hypothetical protein HF521_018190 [Silurus meridionalis]|uniref:Ig-like domain-containing protein n=2 Tax=Silurus meridionalis TaxID=175797 RepID=A0A8T0BI97_SILME|nr:hypothetical protein HF521_018190 [Silurus meridionalis]
MDTVLSGIRWVSADSCNDSKVYQPEKELNVHIGNSVQLQCCHFGKKGKEIIWFRQQNESQPQFIVRFDLTSGVKFYNKFQNSRFQIKKHGNCFNLTILNTTVSDEATYYCALVFSDGTHLKIKGTSKPAVCDSSVVCEATPHKNTTNINTQEKIVLALGSALGLCLLLIFCLTYFILRKRKCKKMNTSIEDSPGLKQESDSESLHYAALQFTKRKTKAQKRDATLQEDCVYSGVYSGMHSM